MDKLNLYYGRGTLLVAMEGYQKAWAMRQGYLSPDHTMDSDDILKSYKLRIACRIRRPCHRL